MKHKSSVRSLPELEARLLEAADSLDAGKGADETDYQHIVNVLDVLQQLDITKVGLATAWK